MRDALDRLRPVWQPHPGQAAFILHPAKTKVLACGRRWGKTDSCAAGVLLSLLGQPPAHCLVLAPTQSQSELLFNRVLDLADQSHRQGLLDSPKLRKSPHPSFRVGPHQVEARSGHVGRSLRGMQATHIVIDEAAFVPESLVHEVAMPMLATTDGHLTLISTPNGRNHFYRMFQMGQRGEHGVWSAAAPSRDNPHVSARFLEVTRELVSERAYAVEYEARFEESRGRVFRAESVEKCLVREFSSKPTGPVCVGVDWARYRDYTAVVVTCGDRDQSWLLEADRFHGLPWSDAVARVAGVVERFPGARVLCDSTGVGDAALEMLQRALTGSKADGYVFTRGSKSALVDQLAMIFDRGSLQMTPDAQLLRELEHFEAVPSGSSVSLQASPGYHDDLVVALALATHQLSTPYRASVRVVHGNQFSQKPQQDHD